MPERSDESLWRPGLRHRTGGGQIEFERRRDAS
jgi:hypothetical protein